MRAKNKEQLHQVLSGFQDLETNGLVHFQVQGINQLQKEIDELGSVDIKILDEDALHRNEITEETENKLAQAGECVILEHEGIY